MKHTLIPRGALLVALAGLAGSALAGPPMICHPFDIGEAKSLPWAGGDNWNNPKPGYDIKRLSADTMALLTPVTPVLVRMETLRRATIYASKDSVAAHELLSQLMARALNAEAGGKSDALAWFDAGYIVESLKQMAPITKGIVPAIDGYAWVRKSIAFGVEAPSMEFAAGLMLAAVPNKGQWPNEHIRKAQAGAGSGSLLARNLSKFK